ncbi:MAG TPA: pectate lyase [Planctomycetaceae bacterium]|nr:pectate lyase [Planctomycetaceae bacterium]
MNHCFFAMLLVCLLPTLGRSESPAGELAQKSDDWFKTAAGEAVLENILSWQTDQGDWAKNLDTTNKRFKPGDEKPSGTFDNGATSGELRLLARAYRVTGESRYREAFLLGFHHILAAQYANGGWPQYFPLSKNYHRHVTFNDGTMIRLMEFLHDVSLEDDFSFLSQDQRAAAAIAVDRGVQCILKCQVIVDGKPTAWCAQHDAVTLAPTGARSYEHPSISGAESGGVMRFLMSIDQPSQEVIRAVNAGAMWYEATKIAGYRYNRSKTGPALSVDDRADELWARFYEIGTNRPIFSDRDGVVKYSLDEIGSERRGGYTWYGNWGTGVLKIYAKWPHRR